MFIKLTRFKNDGQYYLNMNSVWKFERDNSRFTTIVFIDEHIASVTVDETPEEIMKLIEAAKTPMVSINDSDFEGGLQVNACCHREASK